MPQLDDGYHILFKFYLVVVKVHKGPLRHDLSE